MMFLSNWYEVGCRFAGDNSRGRRGKCEAVGDLGFVQQLSCYTFRMYHAQIDGRPSQIGTGELIRSDQPGHRQPAKVIIAVIEQALDSTVIDPLQS